MHAIRLRMLDSHSIARERINLTPPCPCAAVATLGHQAHESEGYVTSRAQDCGDRPFSCQHRCVSVCITGRKRTQEALSSPDAHRPSDGPTSPAQRSSAVLPLGRKSGRSFEWNSKQEVAGWNQRRIGGVPPGWGPAMGISRRGGLPNQRPRRESASATP